MSSTATATATAVRPADRVRQVVVTACEVFCVVGTLVGVGVLGTRVAESSGGALSSAATRLAPGGPAFSIWSVIYAGLLFYAIWQWLPGQATRSVHRRIGYLVAASMVLNASWLLVTQQGWLWASVVVILALALLLGQLLSVLTRSETSGRVDRVVLDGTFGLYLGWVAVASGANITTALIESGLDPGPVASDLAAVAVLAVVAGLGILFATALRGRYAVALAMAWGLTWIAVARTTGEPESTATAVAAVLAALVVLAAAAWAARSGHSTRAPREPVPG